MPAKLANARSSCATQAASAPFCGPVNGARPFRAKQRVLHVAEHGYLDLCWSPIETVHPDLREIGQRRAAGRQPFSVLVQEDRAQGLGHASAAVIGGAAADADQDPFDPQRPARG